MKRREFLRRSLAATLGSGSMLGTLGHLQLAQAASKGLPDFKALVCVYLYGGNDAFNMIVPTDPTMHAVYAASRGNSLFIPLNVASQLPLTPTQAPAGGGTYGLHSGMGPLQQLFNAGRCAVVANVGPLSYPITKAQFQAESVPVPPNLFSHSDQELYWSTALPDSTDKTGWAGRAADALLDSLADQPISPCISLAGANVLQLGHTVQPYFMGVNGTESVSFIEGEWRQPQRNAFDALQALAAAPQAHRFERQYARIMQRARDNHARVSAALASAPTLATTFPESWLGMQLAMVARMVSVQAALGMSRQVFFVGLGGFDTHGDQLATHQELLPDLANCLRAFYDATVELGVSNQVTTFTASEFGRTVSVNGDGTDHGWGGHQFVLGGAVQGQRFYGTLPNLLFEGPDDAAWGQIIPTTAVDQMAATLVRWFGVSDNDVRNLVVPNLGRFGGGSPYLDFLPAV